VKRLFYHGGKKYIWRSVDLTSEKYLVTTIFKKLEQKQKKLNAFRRDPKVQLFQSKIKYFKIFRRKKHTDFKKIHVSLTSSPRLHGRNN